MKFALRELLLKLKAYRDGKALRDLALLGAGAMITMGNINLGGMLILCAVALAAYRLVKGTRK